jgi:ribonuclease HI/transposase InsO family protein
MAALGHFIARSGEKALPFFKLMKRTGKFEWTPEADKAFAERKRYLTSPPIMVAPMFREPLLLYIAVTPRTASAILVAERDAKVIAKEKIDPPCPGAPPEGEAAIPPAPREEPPAATSPTEPLSQSDAPDLHEEKTPEYTTKVQKPMYFISTVLRDARERYTMQQKLLYTLLIASRKLRHYFQGHPIRVVTNRPLETILRNPNVTGRVAEWVVELQLFEISFETTKVIKSKVLAEFTTEWTDPFADEPPEVESTLPGEEALGLWVMHFDGAFNLPSAGPGAVLTSPSGDKIFYAIQLCFKPEHKVSNNIAEYEGLLAGLRATNALGIKRLIIKGDSQLVVNFSNKIYTPKDEHTMAYLEEHRKMEKRFQGLEMKHIPRGENVEADEIAKRASHRLAQPAGVFEERLFKPSASPSTTASELPPALPPPPEQGAPDCGPPSGDRALLALARQEGVDWILELKAFLINSKLPEDESESERIVRQSSGYCVKDGDLYRRRPNSVAVKCISTHQGQELLSNIHTGECGHHASASTLAAKAYRSGIYWPLALWDAAEMVNRCEACQFHAKQIHQPAQELQTIPLTWPFAVWGLDILGPFPRAQGGYRYLYVAIDKFTKWVEVEPVCTIPARSAVKFIRGLVCHFGVPNRIIIDNGSQFTSRLFREYCASADIKICFASVAYPRSNGQAERANAKVHKGLKMRSFNAKLEACSKKWLDNLQSILWSIRNTATKPTGETPFFLVYGVEAVLPTDVKFGSPRVLAFNEIHQEDIIKDCLLQLEEARCQAALHAARYQQGLRC